jgi:Protein of unknown function (DUF3309)
MLLFILVCILVIAIIGSLPTWPHSRMGLFPERQRRPDSRSFIDRSFSGVAVMPKTGTPSFLELLRSFT